MSPGRSGFGRKLFWLAAFNALAFGLIALIVAVAFHRIGTLSAAVASQEMSSVIDNASIGRDLASAFTTIEGVGRGCRTGGVSPEVGEALMASLAQINQRTVDRQIAQGSAALMASTARLLVQCRQLGEIADQARRTDLAMQAELTRLDELLARTVVEQTLAGKTVDHLEQVMSLVTGYRETLLLLAREIAEQADQVPASPPARDAAASMVDDLLLRLQTLTAATPDVARAGRRLIGQALAYRATLRQLGDTRRDFVDALRAGYAAKAVLLQTLQQLDESASGH
ncbi:MAG: hypothetical protein RL375_3283, partial [Pseudomonadota bacterium]